MRHLQIEVSGKTILVDPFISANPKAAHININELKFDYLFLTHAHQDHTLDVEHLMQFNPEAVIVSNAEIVTYYMLKGYKAHMMNQGGSWKFDFGFGEIRQRESIQVLLPTALTGEIPVVLSSKANTKTSTSPAIPHLPWI